jgi:hypothetical protein
MAMLVLGSFFLCASWRTAETDEASVSDSDRDGDRPRTASDSEGPRTDDVDAFMFSYGPIGIGY